MEREEVDAMREFYVKLDNIIGKDSQPTGHIRVIARSGPDLLEQSMQAFGLDESTRGILEIWSSTRGRTYAPIRLDELDILPVECEFVWLKARPKSTL